MRACVAAGALVLAALEPQAALARSGGKLTFVAVLNGGQVVPPSTSNAMGVAFLTFDNATKQLCYSITYSELQGTETEAHLHGGDSGETNAVLYDLNPLGTPKVNCLGPLKPKEEQFLKRGRMYINIHTDVFVAGEIRGQILPIRGAR
jgi:hypothetical protein